MYEYAYGDCYTTLLLCARFTYIRSHLTGSRSYEQSLLLECHLVNLKGMSAGALSPKLRWLLKSQFMHFLDKNN